MKPISFEHFCTTLLRVTSEIQQNFVQCVGYVPFFSAMRLRFLFLYQIMSKLIRFLNEFDQYLSESHKISRAFLLYKVRLK